ncbi:MAG: hypothetical protein MJ219_02095 [Mycoplasmoidaceae bacterium]|nr:hypothetical protein [Mycoplasmoidaceae bacterium]
MSGYINGVVNGEVTFYNVPFYCIMRNVETIDTHAIHRIVSFEPFYELMSTYGDEEPYWQIKTSVYSSLAGEIDIGGGIIERIADD